MATKLSDTPVDDAMVMAHEIAGRSPDAVRGAKKLINRLSNAGAAEHLAAEREINFKPIGSANQVEAITADFENRAPVFRDVGQERIRCTVQNSMNRCRWTHGSGRWRA